MHPQYQMTSSSHIKSDSADKFLQISSDLQKFVGYYEDNEKGYAMYHYLSLDDRIDIIRKHDKMLYIVLIDNAMDLYNKFIAHDRERMITLREILFLAILARIVGENCRI